MSRPARYAYRQANGIQQGVAALRAQVTEGYFEVSSEALQVDFCLYLRKLPLVMEAVIEQLSEYELERGKPMPTLNHAIRAG